jgi:hypothetical protein
MIRAAAIAVLAVLLQDSADLPRLLEAAEKLPLTVPAFPDAVAKLESLAGAEPRVDLKHRIRTLRARSTVLRALHVRLGAMKGTAVEMPLPGSKGSVRILEVTGSSVRIARTEGTQIIPFGDLDPEWSLAECRLGFASDPEAGFTAGLWLASHARWTAAFRELAGTTSDHPLVKEARARGLEALLAQAGAASTGKRWKEAVDRLAEAEKAAPGEPLVAAARERLLRAIADLAKEHSRRSAKKPMEDLVDFIVRHFPGREDLIEEIRDEGRWITISDPKKFGLTSKDGLILLDLGDKPVKGAYAEVEGAFDGISVRVQLNKTSKEAHGGPIWESRSGRIHAWMIRDNPYLMVCRLEEKTSKWHDIAEGGVAPAATYEIRVVLENKEMVVSVNGVEIVRKDVGETEIKSPGIQASHGGLAFDRFRLRKRR